MKSMLKKHKIIADGFCEEILKDSRVEGVMYLGGLARGYADEFSDIDISVFSNEPLKDLRLGERFTPEGFDLEIFNVAINEGFEKWPAIQKEAYEEGIIASDKNGKVRGFLDKALRFENDYRTKRALELIFDMAWHGWVYTPYKNRDIKGYRWILPEDLWFRRSNVQNAFYVAQKCVGDFIELLFAANNKWTPDFKWRFVKLFNLSRLPENAKEKFDYLLFTAWNEQTWDKKRMLFQQMLDETIEALIQDFPDNWYEVIDH